MSRDKRYLLSVKEFVMNRHPQIFTSLSWKGFVKLSEESQRVVQHASIVMHSNVLHLARSKYESVRLHGVTTTRNNTFAFSGNS